MTVFLDLSEKEEAYRIKTKEQGQDMKKAILVVFLILMALMVSCKNDVTEEMPEGYDPGDPELVGTWSDNHRNAYTFEADGRFTYYSITYKGEVRDRFYGKWSASDGILQLEYDSYYFDSKNDATTPTYCDLISDSEGCYFVVSYDENDFSSCMPWWFSPDTATPNLSFDGEK